jgi:hypothetical protein
MAGEPKLNTITDPGVFFDINRFDRLMSRFLRLFLKVKSLRQLGNLNPVFRKYFKFYTVLRASPQSSLIRLSPHMKRIGN